MLENSKFKLNDVITVKLSSGEEIIARFDTETDNALHIFKPMMLTATQSSLGLAPFSITGKCDRVKLYRTAVMTILPTDEEYSKQYLTAVTGIIT